MDGRQEIERSQRISLLRGTFHALRDQHEWGQDFRFPAQAVAASLQIDYPNWVSCRAHSAIILPRKHAKSEDMTDRRLRPCSFCILLRREPGAWPGSELFRASEALDAFLPSPH